MLLLQCVPILTGVSESRKEKTEKRSAIFNDSVKTSDVGGSENSPGKLAGKEYAVR